MGIELIILIPQISHKFDRHNFDRFITGHFPGHSLSFRMKFIIFLIALLRAVFRKQSSSILIKLLHFIIEILVCILQVVCLVNCSRSSDTEYTGFHQRIHIIQCYAAYSKYRKVNSLFF